MAILIRQLQKGDALQYKALRLKAIETDADMFLMTSNEENAFSLKQVEQKIEQDFILGAFEKENLVGSLVFMRQIPSKFRHIGILGGMYVDPLCRNKGIGKKLISEMLDHIKSLPDVYSLQLKVVTSNDAAIKLYESFGFKIWASEKNALKDGDRFLDQHHMMCVLFN